MWNKPYEEVESATLQYQVTQRMSAKVKGSLVTQQTPWQGWHMVSHKTEGETLGMAMVGGPRPVLLE